VVFLPRKGVVLFEAHTGRAQSGRLKDSAHGGFNTDDNLCRINKNCGVLRERGNKMFSHNLPKTVQHVSWKFFYLVLLQINKYIKNIPLCGKIYNSRQA
jgi:hypothetical protein